MRDLDGVTAVGRNSQLRDEFDGRCSAICITCTESLGARLVSCLFAALVAI
jgi:hypothetical protein